MARKQLTYFRPIAETDGLVDLVCDLLSDLKRQEIWPDGCTRFARVEAATQRTASWPTCTSDISAS